MIVPSSEFRVPLEQRATRNAELGTRNAERRIPYVPDPGPPVRHPHPAPHARIQPGRRGNAGAGDRGQHRDLQRGPRGAAQAARLTRTRSHRHGGQCVSRRGRARTNRQCRARLLRSTARHHGIRGAGDVQARQPQRRSRRCCDSS